MKEITIDDFTEWLEMAILFKVPLSLFKKEDLEQIYFIKASKEDEQTAINGFVAVHRRPILPIPSAKNIAYIPGLYNYAISKNGNILYLPEKRFLQNYISSDYVKINIISVKTNGYMTVAVHRLVAFTWVKNPSPETKVVVNHLDGDKENIHFKNLEWATVLENNTHAINSGLCPYTHKLKVFDVQLQTEHFFYSLEQARKFMGFNYPLAKVQLLTASGLVNKRYEIRFEGDLTPWKFLGKSLDFTSPSTKRVLVQAKNFKTGEVVEMLGVRNLSRVLNIERRIIKNYLKDNRNILYKDWMFRKASNEPWPEPGIKRRELKLKLFNPENGEVKDFDSVKNTLDFLGTTNRKTLLKYINTGIIYKNYIITS